MRHFCKFWHSPRKFQQTPGTNPRYPKIQIWKDFLHKKQVVEGLGYVQRVCWNFLRWMNWFISSLFRNSCTNLRSLTASLPLKRDHVWKECILPNIISQTFKILLPISSCLGFSQRQNGAFSLVVYGFLCISPGVNPFQRGLLDILRIVNY